MGAIAARAIAVSLFGWTSLNAAAQVQMDPALQLRNYFVQSYVGRAVERGDGSARAQKEGECIFDLMAQRLTVEQYISLSAHSETGEFTRAQIPDGVLQDIKRRCINDVRR